MPATNAQAQATYVANTMKAQRLIRYLIIAAPKVAGSKGHRLAPSVLTLTRMDI